MMIKYINIIELSHYHNVFKFNSILMPENFTFEMKEAPPTLGPLRTKHVVTEGPSSRYQATNSPPSAFNKVWHLLECCVF